MGAAGLSTNATPATWASKKLCHSEQEYGPLGRWIERETTGAMWPRSSPAVIPSRPQGGVGIGCSVAAPRRTQGVALQDWTRPPRSLRSLGVTEGWNVKVARFLGRPVSLRRARFASAAARPRNDGALPCSTGQPGRGRVPARRSSLRGRQNFRERARGANEVALDVVDPKPTHDLEGGLVGDRLGDRADVEHAADLCD